MSKREPSLATGRGVRGGKSPVLSVAVQAPLGKGSDTDEEFNFSSHGKIVGQRISGRRAGGNTCGDEIT